MTLTCNSFSLNNHFKFFYITLTLYYTAHIVKKPSHLLHQKIVLLHVQQKRNAGGNQRNLKLLSLKCSHWRNNQDVSGCHSHIIYQATVQVATGYTMYDALVKSHTFHNKILNRKILNKLKSKTLKITKLKMQMRLLIHKM